MVKKVSRSEEEWRSRLTPEQYEVTRHKGTEVAFTGKYCKHEGTGTYKCSACGNPLFGSETKFDSGTGWPSFTAPLSRENVEQKEDTSLDMVRTEVLCSACGAHLGHAFEDRPEPGGMRYCINSIALDFEDKNKAGKRKPK
jgi:peptide-methionine (R)-S-oxide reductase